MTTGWAATRAPSEIFLLYVGGDWPLESLQRERSRVDALLDAGARRSPTTVVRIADAVSRRWLERNASPQLAEIDRIVEELGRPGAHHLNGGCEWGCATAAIPSGGGAPALLARALDGPDPGLGRNVIAVRVQSPPGPRVSLCRFGRCGVLQAVAPGRFAAPLNQAPLEGSTGVNPLDCLAARAQVRRRPRPTASWLPRRVFETEPDCATARATPRGSPIAAGATCTFVCPEPGESRKIERRAEEAHVLDGPAVAADAWQAPGWRGRPRSEANPERIEAIRPAEIGLDPAFGWLRPTVLNDATRLACVADPASGAFVAQGWEANGPATAPLQAAA